ncbi:SRPBCC domain-containing protein [Alcanivorax sp. JB21]|uniref:SRPBCC family protein n=1 Tax=Alcanivorax limicola TaxID=2874102 RepID=UPI001CBDF20B|nr:SRPBCC domain-containing protein [Alcanivorax limicola]MBZ2188848.1 SRPBCC domain-containing protein [Alcanivorax limicola]
MSKRAEDTQSVVVERELLHPPEKVWRALTQPHLMEAWLTKTDFSAAVGHCFALQFDWGAVECRVLELAQHQALSYTWESGALKSVVHWTLTPTAKGTLLRMEQAGFASADSPDYPQQARYYMGAKAGWPRFMAALERVLKNEDEGVQQ